MDNIYGLTSCSPLLCLLWTVETLLFTICGDLPVLLLFLLVLLFNVTLVIITIILRRRAVQDEHELQNMPENN